MKIQVLQDKLAKAVSTASRFASTRSQLPVLTNLHFKTKGTKLIVNATNLEVSISLSLGAQVQVEGELTVPSKIISDIVMNLPNKPIDLEVDKEQLKISSENFSSTVLAMNANDFPKVPTILPKEAIELPIKGFIDALSKVLFSVSQDESRPTLCGVLFLFGKNGIEAIGTDGFRLSQKKIKGSSFEEEFRVIVPRAILSELTRLSGDSETLTFFYNKEENQVVFGFPGIVISSRVIDGAFPPYEKIIPKDDGFKMNIDKEEFLRAVKLSSVFAKDAANVIKVLLKKKGIEIVSDSKTAGSQKSFVDAAGVGEVPVENQIAFNYRFLEEVVGVMEAESMDMSFTGANAPGVFRDPKDKDYLHLIMPVKIQV